jgi:glucokinase
MRKNTLILGIDVGASFTKFGLVTKQGKLLKFEQTATPQTKKKIINFLIDIIKPYQSRISGVGLGLPGRVDIKLGKIIAMSNLPLANLPIVGLIKQRINLPIKIDNDARCFTLAESLIGSGKNYSTVIGLTLGTGVGGGIVIDRQLFYGRGNAGEIGHQFIDYKKAKDLEDYLGAGRLKLTSVDYQSLEKLASQNNRTALKFWNNLGLTLGFGCLNLIHAFDPDIIILGGKQTRAFGLFYPAMLKIINKYCLVKPPKIVKSKLIDWAGIIGAALLFK